MHSIRSTALGLAGVCSFLALGACSKTDEARMADSPAAAVPVATDSPRMLEVGDIDMGRHIGPDQKITDKTDDFAPKDTMFAAVDTKNAGTARLTARWTAEDGKVVNEETKDIAPAGDATTAFFTVAPATPGKYTVHILLNDAEVKTKDVTVKKP